MPLHGRFLILNSYILIDLDTQNLPCRGKKPVTTTLDDSGVQKFSHLNIPTKYQYLIGTRILIPIGKCFDTIIDVDH